MDPNSSIWLLGIAFGLSLILTALAAAAETAFRLLRQTQLAPPNHNATHNQSETALLQDPVRVVVALLILTGIGLMGAGSTATLLGLQAVPLGWPRWLFSLGLGILVLLVGLVIPKLLAVCRPEAVVRLATPPLRLLMGALWPLLQLVSGVSRLLSRLAGEAATPMNEAWMLSEDELRRLVNAVGEAAIDEDEREMIAGIFELGQTVAREVMVPRIDMVAVEANTPLLKALDVIIRHGHSRIPVYEGTIDHIIGILYAKDLLEYLRDGRTDVPLREIVRKAYFIPESKHIDELLHELQRKKVHIAIVVDEYGGTAGLVTIEDLLEEIVGEIQDEYDREEAFVERVNDHEAIFDARIHLDEVNELLGLDLPTEQGDTLGGLIYSELGKIPAPGERITLDGVTIEVLSVSGRRIRKVKVTKETDTPAAKSDALQAKDPGRADLLGDVVA